MSAPRDDARTPGAMEALPGDAIVLRAAEESLAGRRSGLRGLALFPGPAFIAAVAYVDQGDFATNMAAGTEYGFLLVWVVVAVVVIGLNTVLLALLFGGA